MINDPDIEGSTFNLFQEMSLGPAVPQRHRARRTGIATADFTDAPGFDFTPARDPGQHLHRRHDLRRHPGRRATAPRSTPSGSPTASTTCPATPSSTAPTPTARRSSTRRRRRAPDIDSGCGDTGKLVCDAAAIADPEIDYSDYDTDKDGVVDFFMVVFAGCGGNGASQLAASPAAPTPTRRTTTSGRTRSSLEFYYTDPVTGLPGYTTDDQLKNLEGQPLWYTDDTYADDDHRPTPATPSRSSSASVPTTSTPRPRSTRRSVISHEYGHSPRPARLLLHRQPRDLRRLEPDGDRQVAEHGRLLAARSSAGSCPRCSTADRTETGIDRTPRRTSARSPGSSRTGRRTR